MESGVGNPLTVLQQGQLADPQVKTGVLDSHAGRRRQGDYELLVDVGEDLGGCLVGEVEVPENLLPDSDGDAEERLHRRMVRRKPVTVGMLVEVGQPDRLGVHDQQPEDAVALGEVADRLALLVRQPHGDELAEAGPGVVQHP